MKLKDKLISAVSSVKNIANNVINGDKVFVDKKIQMKRHQTCLTCDKYIKSTGQCGECSCFCRAKTSLNGEKCPLGKW